MTTETIHHSPTHSGEPLLIFLLPGNPGLVSYYKSYLAQLHSLCASALPQISTTIHACSLSGFSTTPHNTPLLDLDGQITYMDAALGQAWDEACAAAGRDVKVVLLGHSVGAYMLLELVRRRRGGKMRIVGGVCLTPTVVDLRGSPSGQKVGWLGAQSWFAPTAAGLAKTLLWPIPDAALLGIVKRVTGQPDDAAQTTFAFLRSQTGIHQALHMLRYELAQMTTDQWDDELWGVLAKSDGPRTKLFFYFAPDDHWVADRSRDKLIAARAFSGKPGEEGRPHMEIADGNLPHAFCIHDSERVAEKTLGYIRDIVDSNWK